MKKCILPVLLLLGSACSDDSPKNFFAPFVQDKKVVDGSTSDVFNPQADILFVIDDSGSMRGHQNNLATNVNLFTSIFLKTSIIDYNIGVITTDADGTAPFTCCGKLVGGTKIVTKTTPNAEDILKSNLKVGISGSGTESPFETTTMALSPPMLAGYNKGFMRAAAALIVIFITDAEDQSPSVTPQTLLNELLALKNNDNRRLLSYGAIIPTGESNCVRDSFQTPRRLEEFLDLVPNGKGGGGLGNNIVSLCAADYGERLANFALEIVEKINSTIFLTRLPDKESLRVTYGSIDLPMDPKKGWSYSPQKNVIYLGRDIDWAAQPPGSKVEVHYKEARGNDGQ